MQFLAASSASASSLLSCIRLTIVLAFEKSKREREKKSSKKMPFLLMILAEKTRESESTEEIQAYIKFKFS